MSEVKENVESHKKGKIGQLLSKLKKNKGIEIAIVIILVCVMILIALSTFRKSDDTEEVAISIDKVEAYRQMLETKLGQVLSQINGAGAVSCMITLEGGFEQQLAYSTEESTTQGDNGTTSTQNSSTSQSVVYVVENGTETPLVLYQQNPKIAGVIVVCPGAKDMNVKLDIIRAVSAALNVDVSCIEVFVGK